MAKMGLTVSHIDGRKQNMKNFLKVRKIGGIAKSQNIYRNKNIWVQMEAGKRIYWYSIWAIGEDSWLEIPNFDWPQQKVGLRLAYVQNP